MRKKIIALDIRFCGLTAVCVRRGLKGKWIEACESFEFEDDVLSEENLCSGLETVLEKIDPGGSVFMVSVPSDSVFFRNIRLPFKDVRKIRQILPFEMESLIPIPIEDVVIDFHTLADLNSNSAPVQDTHVVAGLMALSQVKYYLDILERYHIKPKVLTISGFSSASHLGSDSEMPGQWIFLSLDTHVCSIFAMMESHICLVRSFYPCTSADKCIEEMIRNIQHTIAGFEELFVFDFHPELVVLSGEIKIPGLDAHDMVKQITAHLDIQVKRMDLVRQAGIASRTMNAYAETASDAMNNAVALALIETENIKSLNFRKGPFAAINFWAENKSHVIKTGIIAMIVLLMSLGTLLMDTYYMEGRLDRVSRKINTIFRQTFPQITAIVDPLHQMRVEMEKLKETAFVPVEADQYVMKIDILNALSLNIPENVDVEFNRLVISQDSALISGDTDTFNSVDDMKNNLEKVEIFKKVDITSANMDRSGKRVQFKMKINL